MEEYEQRQFFRMNDETTPSFIGFKASPVPIRLPKTIVLKHGNTFTTAIYDYNTGRELTEIIDSNGNKLH